MCVLLKIVNCRERAVKSLSLSHEMKKRSCTGLRLPKGCDHAAQQKETNMTESLNPVLLSFHIKDTPKSEKKKFAFIETA